MSRDGHGPGDRGEAVLAIFKRGADFMKQLMDDNEAMRKQLGDQRWYVDGEAARLSTEGTFIGIHVMVPRQGVAIHINAFNFPIWGMLEKVAVNLLAGMPAVVKPSEVTSFLTEAMVRDIARGFGIEAADRVA